MALRIATEIAQFLLPYSWCRKETWTILCHLGHALPCPETGDKQHKHRWARKSADPCNQRPVCRKRQALPHSITNGASTRGPRRQCSLQLEETAWDKLVPTSTTQEKEGREWREPVVWNGASCTRSNKEGPTLHETGRSLGLTLRAPQQPEEQHKVK